MPAYENSSIYKLCHRNPIVKDFYIGSTTNFTRRKYNHKACLANGNKDHINLYQFIKATGNWENWEMVELENYHATNKRDLHRREREWIEKEKPTLNMRLPILSAEEYKKMCGESSKKWKREHPESNRASVKKWKNNNREKYNAYQQQSCICSCGTTTNRNHLARHRRSQYHQKWIKENDIPGTPINEKDYIINE
jgi:hypothetical protein